MTHSELLSHERYLSKTKTEIKTDEVMIGDILHCMYQGKKDEKEIARYVFVLNPEYEEKMHLIDIDKISHLMLLQLVTKLKTDMSPYDFYHKIIKRSFPEYKEAYRTYIITNIHNTARMDYNGLFSLSPLIKSEIYQTNNTIAISYDKKGVNIPANHPLLTRVTELAESHGVYYDVKPNKKVSDFIKRYASNAKFVKSYKTDMFQPSIFQLKESVKSGGVFFVDKGSISVLYSSVEE